MKNFLIQYRRAAIALLMILLNGVGASASTPWEVNPSDYQYDMSLYLDVTFAANDMDYALYDVGAFSGEECRGVAERLPLSNGSECLYLRVRSNQETGETMTFKYRNKETGEVLPIDGVSFQFESNGRLGYPSEPFAVRIVRHFDVNLSASAGGTLSHEGGRIAEGTTLSVTAIPSEGHHFEQWSDGTTDNPKEIVVDGDITLSAQFAVNTYKLTYTVDGAAYKELEVPYGMAIEPEAYPEKEGHTFSGWEGLPATMPAHDVTAAGTFAINSYEAVFKVDGQEVSRLTFVYGEPVVAPAAPFKEGHTFAEWEGMPETMPARDVEIIGRYTVNAYKLTYTVDGATYKEMEVNYGTAIEPEACPEKEGHTFSGWEGLPETMPAHDVEVTGQFTVNSYKLTYSVDGATYKELEVAYGTTVVPEPNPEREGHTFSGWEGLPETMPAHDVAVTGQFTVNIYTLTYTVDGETYKELEVPYGTAIEPEAYPEKEGHTFSGWEGLPETMPAHDVTVGGTFSVNSYEAVFMADGAEVSRQTVVYGQPVVAPEAPAKEGHTFAGWENLPETMPAHDVEITARYTVNIYTLTYTVDGETYKEVEVAYGTAIEPEAYPEREGHTFSGWEGLPETMPAYDMTVGGTFSVNSYEAVFMADGAEVSRQTVVYGQPVVAPEAPSKEGHTFAGWENLPETMPAHDVEITARYTVNVYTLTYTVDGETYKELEVPYGTAVEPEAYPEKEGHTFSGWEGLPATMPAHDVTVGGTFSVNSYEAVFMADGAEVSRQTVVYGQPVVAPEAPAKEGHTFAGWENLPETMPAHDVEITARYTVNVYTLTYTVDGETYKELEVPYGTAIESEAYPEKEGHTFSGWEGLPATMPAHDVTASGTFSVNSYCLTWYLNDEVYREEEVEYGAVISVLEPEVPEGMEFDGWQDEIPTTMPAHDVDIHGTYSQVSSIRFITLDDDAKVSVYSLSGHLICKEMPWRDAQRNLKPGIYVINGTKYRVGK